MEEKVLVYDKYISEKWEIFFRNGNFYTLVKEGEIVIINRAFNSVVKGPTSLSVGNPGFPEGNI
jgi:hypothetical protein